MKNKTKFHFSGKKIKARLISEDSSPRFHLPAVSCCPPGRWSPQGLRSQGRSLPEDRLEQAEQLRQEGEFFWHIKSGDFFSEWSLKNLDWIVRLEGRIIPSSWTHLLLANKAVIDLSSSGWRRRKWLTTPLLQVQNCPTSFANQFPRHRGVSRSSS